jgi:hypothetical protein
MGKNEIRVIHVPRWVTVALWILVTAAMVSTIHLLSGHAYHRQSSFAEVAAMVYRYDQGTASSSVLLATIAPATADALFFLPWGALAFLSLDGAERPRKRVYLATIALGVAFAFALVAWQQWLLTRVTEGVDVLWTAVGCAAGATLAHARKRVRVRFE